MAARPAAILLFCVCLSLVTFVLDVRAQSASISAGSTSGDIGTPPPLPPIAYELQLSPNITTPCPVQIVLKGAPSFTHSIFETLILNAAETVSDPSDLLDPCPGCVFSWTVCHFLDRANDCIEEDSLPPPFANLSAEHSRILNLPLAVANKTCTNATGHVNGVNSSCAASPFGDFDPMALSGETYRFRVFVRDPATFCTRQAYVDVYFEIILIPEESGSSSSDCFPMAYAQIEGPSHISRSIFGNLLINASGSHIDDSHYEHYICDEKCSFSWAVCRVIHDGCSFDIPPILSDVYTMNTSVINISLIEDSCQIDNFGNINQSCVALAAETFRFRVTVNNGICPHTHDFLTVHFDDFLSNYSEECSSQAILNGPDRHNVYDPLALDGSESYKAEAGDGCPECQFSWSVCMLHTGGSCVPTSLAYLNRIADNQSDKFNYLPLDDGSTCKNFPPERCGVDPVTKEEFDISLLLDRTFRFTLTLMTSLQCEVSATLDVLFFESTPGCGLVAVLETIPTHGPFAVEDPLVLDASASHHLGDVELSCPGCVFFWSVCQWLPEDYDCVSDNLPPPLQPLMNTLPDKFVVDPTKYPDLFAEKSFQVTVEVTDEAQCKASKSIRLDFQRKLCTFLPTIEGSPGFSHSIFDELTLDASGTHDPYFGSSPLEGCVDCDFAWSVCHVMGNECGFNDIPIPFVMLHAEHDPIIHLPLALLNVSCQNNSNITIGINSSCAANPYGDFDMMALSGETFRFILTVKQGERCEKRTFVDIYFDIVGFTSSSIFTQYENPCDVSAVVLGYPGFMQSVYDPLVLNASLSYLRFDQSLCKDCTYTWRACHVLANECVSTDLPPPLSVVPLANTSVVFLPLVLTNVSCNSNITMGPGGICGVSPYGDFDVLALAGETFRFSLILGNSPCLDTKSIDVRFRPIPCLVNAVLDGPSIHVLPNILTLSAERSSGDGPNECTDCKFSWSLCMLTSNSECSTINLPQFLGEFIHAESSVIAIPFPEICKQFPCEALYNQAIRVTVVVARDRCNDTQWLDIKFVPCGLQAVLGGSPWFPHSVFENLLIDASSTLGETSRTCADCNFRWSVCHRSTKTGECIDTDLPPMFTNVSQSDGKNLSIPLIEYRNMSCTNHTDVVIRDNGTCIGPVGAFDALALSGETYMFKVFVSEGVCESSAQVDVFFEVLEVFNETIPTETPIPPPPLTHTPTLTTAVTLTPPPTHTNTPPPLATMTPTLTFIETYGEFFCDTCLTFYYVWDDYDDDSQYCELLLPFDENSDEEFIFTEEGTFSYLDGEDYPDDYTVPWDGHQMLYNEEESGVIMEDPWNSWLFVYDMNPDWEDPNPETAGVKDGFGETFVMSLKPDNGTYRWVPSPSFPYQVTLYPQCNVPAVQSPICTDEEDYVCDVYTMAFNVTGQGHCNCIQIDEESTDKAQCVVDAESEWNVCETEIKECDRTTKVNGRVKTQCGSAAVKLAKGSVYRFALGEGGSKKGSRFNPLQDSPNATRQLVMSERDPGQLGGQTIILKNLDGAPTNVTSFMDASQQTFKLSNVQLLTLAGTNLTNTNITGMATSVTISGSDLKPSFGSNTVRGYLVTLTNSNSTGNVTLLALDSVVVDNMNQTDNNYNESNPKSKRPTMVLSAPTVNFTGRFEGGGVVVLVPSSAAYAYNPEGFPRNANITITLTLDKRKQLRLLSSKFGVQQSTMPTLWVCGKGFSLVTVDSNTAIGLSLTCDGKGGPMTTPQQGDSVLKMNPGSTLIFSDYATQTSQSVVPYASKCIWSGTPPFLVQASPAIFFKQTIRVLECGDLSQAVETPALAAGSCQPWCTCNISVINKVITIVASCPLLAPSPSEGPSPFVNPRGAAPGGASSIDIGLILGLVLGLVLGCLLLLLIAYYLYRRRKMQEKELEEGEVDFDAYHPEFPDIYVEPVVPMPSPTLYPTADAAAAGAADRAMFSPELAAPAPTPLQRLPDPSPYSFEPSTPAPPPQPTISPYMNYAEPSPYGVGPLQYSPDAIPDPVRSQSYTGTPGLMTPVRAATPPPPWQLPPSRYAQPYISGPYTISSPGPIVWRA